MSVSAPRERATRFTYLGLDVSATALIGHYRLDDLDFFERVDFEHVDSLDRPEVLAVATLWYLVAGLSYYKAGAAREVDFGDVELGPRARTLLHAAYLDGLGEFAFRNDLDLGDVVFVGGHHGSNSSRESALLDANRVLIPFGGGIDSVVTTETLNPALERALFVVSPASGRFAPLEATAAVTGLDVVRARRTLDPKIARGVEGFFQGHVPVTAMVTLLASVAAVASGRGGVVMSNEHSASVDNLTWRGRGVNHQWSKSFAGEVALGEALGERLGEALRVASFLRDRSELWVAQVFSQLPHYHHVFRSCNRAFRQNVDDRATGWCGECDKCLFINLMLAPFLERDVLREIFHAEPLSNVALRPVLETLVGVGLEHKPFECVGDPTECASALALVALDPAWRDVAHLAELAARVRSVTPLNVLLAPQGESRVPAHWLR